MGRLPTVYAKKTINQNCYASGNLQNSADGRFSSKEGRWLWKQQHQSKPKLSPQNLPSRILIILLISYQNSLILIITTQCPFNQWMPIQFPQCIRRNYSEKSISFPNFTKFVQIIENSFPLRTMNHHHIKS